MNLIRRSIPRLDFELFFSNLYHATILSHVHTAPRTPSSWSKGAIAPPQFYRILDARMLTAAYNARCRHGHDCNPVVRIGPPYHRHDQECMAVGMNLELINVISMILFPHDLLTPDADRTPCTPSLPRDRIKGHVYLSFVNTNTFGMPISCRGKLKRPKNPLPIQQDLKPAQGRSP